MTRVFADTFYFLALLNEADAAHARAVAFASSAPNPYVTTTWVLTEVADAFSAKINRRRFLQLLVLLEADSKSLVVPATQELFDRAVELYGARSDQDWSLTDCISFVVMHEHGLTDALTGDRHFEQAGFNALLKS